MLEVKVLGPGCTNCNKVEQITRQAADYIGVEATITKVSDYSQIMEYDILSTPGLVINEKVVCSGRVPSLAEVTTWLADAELASTP